MLKLAVIAFGLVVLLGGTLAIQIMRAPARQPSRVLAWLHGIVALGSYGVLLAALTGPPPADSLRGAATGTQSFGLVAALLLVLALLLGILALALHLVRKRMPGIAIGVHASVAIAGYVILAVYWLV
jgi:hypothetical protein